MEQHNNSPLKFNPYHYLFYYLQYNASRIRKYQSRETAIIYLSVIVFFYSTPFIAAGTHSIYSNPPEVLFYGVLLAYAFLIFYGNKRHFERKDIYAHIMNRYKRDSKSFVLLGRVIAWVVFISSFAAFLLILAAL